MAIKEGDDVEAVAAVAVLAVAEAVRLVRAARARELHAHLRSGSELACLQHWTARARHGNALVLVRGDVKASVVSFNAETEQWSARCGALQAVDLGLDQGKGCRGPHTAHARADWTGGDEIMPLLSC